MSDLRLMVDAVLVGRDVLLLLSSFCCSGETRQTGIDNGRRRGGVVLGGRGTTMPGLPTRVVVVVSWRFIDDDGDVRIEDVDASGSLYAGGGER